MWGLVVLGSNPHRDKKAHLVNMGRSSSLNLTYLTGAMQEQLLNRRKLSSTLSSLKEGKDKGAI